MWNGNCTSRSLYLRSEIAEREQQLALAKVVAAWIRDARVFPPECLESTRQETVTRSLDNS